jgi:two-component system sensor histidine kinase CpxA
MKIKFPLYAKIVFWFFLNLIFLGAVFLVVAHGQFRFGLDSLIAGPAGERMEAVTKLLTGELRERPQADWNGVLERYSEANHVKFFLFHNGEELAGAPVTIPAEVRARLSERRLMNPPRMGPGPDHGPPDETGRPPKMNDFGPPPDEREHRHGGPMDGPSPKFMVHASSPSQYWVLAPVALPGIDQGPRPSMAVLAAVSDSLSGGGLFFDLTSWVMAGIAVVVVSALFWFPLVRGITRSISRMTRATEQIAEGRFEVRAQVRRRDELGSLSEAIDRMAGRLSGFVAGQKRFLGDIAHELCSPIARIQVALGILEQRADEKQKMYLADLREEVQEMTKLVDELLMFSKASMGGANIKVRTVPLRAVVEKAAARESGLGGVEIKFDVPETLQVMAEPELLQRAVGNILRNAIRYAGQAGPIVISSVASGGNVDLIIDDNGPGIPESAIAQVFDPFYRVDTSRDRETGGVGLGLSIVKTCVESCGGTVRCENRQPHGLRVVVRLKQ